MKKFSFSLDRVLAWRRMQQEQERATLEKLVGDSQSLAHRAETVRAGRRAYEQSLSRSRYFDSTEVGTLPQWQLQVKKSLGLMAVEQEQMDARVARQRTKLREAERTVKLLERLRDRRVAAWELELSREMEAFAGEAYLAGCIRLKESNRRARSSGG